MRIFLLIVLSSLSLSPAAWACTWCRPRVQAGIYTPAYSANVLLVLLPVVLLLVFGLVVFYWDKLRLYFTFTYAAH